MKAFTAERRTDRVCKIGTRQSAIALITLNVYLLSRTWHVLAVLVDERAVDAISADSLWLMREQQILISLR